MKNCDKCGEAYRKFHVCVIKGQPKDMRGQDIGPGDTLAYAALRGKSAFVRTGKVVTIRPDSVGIRIVEEGRFERWKDADRVVHLKFPERTLKLEVNE